MGTIISVGMISADLKIKLSELAKVKINSSPRVTSNDLKEAMNLVLKGLVKQCITYNF